MMLGGKAPISLATGQHLPHPYPLAPPEMAMHLYL